MARTPSNNLPVKVKRTGMHQLCISLPEQLAKELERTRIESGLRSWSQVIRMLIADAMVKRHKRDFTKGETA